MCTVGYGDVVPVNDIEFLFSIITTMIVCGIFGYSIN